MPSFTIPPREAGTYIHVSDRPILDLLRWISAVVVAAGHILGIVITRGTQGSLNLTSVLSYISDLRGPSVIVFFVLSGYLVGGSVLRRREGFTWPPYLIARTSRIYAVLLPALAFTALVDLPLLATHGDQSVYTQVWRSGVLGADTLAARYGPLNIISSLLCLEPFFGRPIGSNGALWSLGYEWVFYLAFPAVVLLGARQGSRLGPYAVAAAVLVALFAVGARVMAGFAAVWIAGACAEQASREGHLPLLASRAAGALALAALLLSPVLDRRLVTVLIGLPLALFLARRDPLERFAAAPVHKRLSAFSYSLYLTHLPAVVLVAEVADRFGLLDQNGLAFGWLASGLVGIMALVAFAVARAFYWAFESRTGQVRRLMFARLGPGTHASGATT